MGITNNTFKDKLLERFLSYVKINTQSSFESETVPSMAGQLVLAELLSNELKSLALTDVYVSKHGIVYATLESNTPEQIPTIGFLAHLDTSPEMSGADVKPQIITHYDGGDIMLNKDKQIILSPNIFPELNNYKGQTLIASDGTTLLGADNKAGIAEILTAIDYLQSHPNIKHGKVKLAFTPDEEIGKGTENFDVKAFNAAFAYTIDGDKLGVLEYENFNAAQAVISINGINMHPGYAKNKMLNAIHLAQEFLHLLPALEKPEHTENYEGFFHTFAIEGSVEKATLKIIIRDHDCSLFEKRKAFLIKTIENLNTKYKFSTHDTVFEVEIHDQYHNMKDILEAHFYVVEYAKQAIIEAGVKPIIVPIRGGTDGARLAYMGLPCPNIFTGGHNFHGRYEYIPLESMFKAVEVIVNIVKIVAKN